MILSCCPPVRRGDHGHRQTTIIRDVIDVVPDGSHCWAVGIPVRPAVSKNHRVSNPGARITTGNSAHPVSAQARAPRSHYTTPVHPTLRRDRAPQVRHFARRRSARKVVIVISVSFHIHLPKCQGGASVAIQLNIATVASAMDAYHKPDNVCPVAAPLQRIGIPPPSVPTAGTTPESNHCASR